MSSIGIAQPDFDLLGDLDDDFRQYLLTGEFGRVKSELPRNEFEQLVGNGALRGASVNTLKDTFSVVSGVKSLFQHLTISEFIIITLLSTGMTVFFCLYHYPVSPVEDYILSARMRFTIIVTAVLFPSTLLVSETMRRRELCLQKYATIKGMLCNILLAFLTWRSKSIGMSDEWDDAAYETVKEFAKLLNRLLTLPTLRDRHTYTKRGMLFASKVQDLSGRLHSRLVCLNMDLHACVEDMKAEGLTPMESIRIFQYIHILSREFEQIWNIKVYRTARAARVFVRTILSACIMFYGPYFSFVAGAMHDQPATMGLTYSIVLSIVSTVTLLAIVAMHRATEDAFLWWYPGNAVNVKFETDDALEKLETIYRSRKLVNVISEHSPLTPPATPARL